MIVLLKFILFYFLNLDINLDFFEKIIYKKRKIERKLMAMEGPLPQMDPIPTLTLFVLCTQEKEKFQREGNKTYL